MRDRVGEEIDDIHKAIRRGSIDGSPDYAFDEGYKIFYDPSLGLRQDEREELIRRLDDEGIACEIVVNGQQMATWATRCYLVWKKA
jgi:hypothetical protein